jgi:hypothetical protein
MRNDLYLRVVLSVIAAALVYLCVVFTPMPVTSAQGRVVGAKTPGEYTGPAEVVIIGWQLPDGASLPVNVLRGDVRVNNEVMVKGDVEVKQPPNNPLRTVMIGHEVDASPSAAGRFSGITPSNGRGIPVVVLPRPQ